MKLRKILVAGLLFIATAANVMAADYDAFGGRDVKVTELLPKLAMRKVTGTQYDLTLSNDMYQKLRNVVAAEFSHMEKYGGTKNKPVSQYLIRFVKGIYDDLETAAVEGKFGLPLPTGVDEGETKKKAAIGWFSGNLKKTSANKVIRIDIATILSGSEALVTANEDVTSSVKATVTWDMFEVREAAVSLKALNGTPGALRPATEATKRTTGFDNAQAAYEAYQAALSKKGTKKDAEGRAEVSNILTKAAQLRFGSNDRDLKYLADKEKRADFTTEDMRLAKARLAAKKDEEYAKVKSASSLNEEEKVAVHFYKGLLSAIQAGALNVLEELPEARVLDLEDIDSFKTQAQSEKLLALVAASGRGYTSALLTNIALKQQAADLAALELAKKSQPKSTSSGPGGSHGRKSSLSDDDSDLEAGGLFGDDDIF